jgi:hypothetical protein
VHSILLFVARASASTQPTAEDPTWVLRSYPMPDMETARRTMQNFTSLLCTAVASSGSQACRCTTGSQCSTSCCAPAADSNNNLLGFSICQVDLGGLYECCNSTPCFGVSDCCVVDALGNQYCAEPCSSSSTCGAGHCDTDDFSHTICSGDMACGN